MSETDATVETIDLSDLYDRLGQMIEWLMVDARREVHVRRYGRPVAVMTSWRARETMQGDHK